jgi:hypothetical protein
MLALAIANVMATNPCVVMFHLNWRLLWLSLLQRLGFHSYHTFREGHVQASKLIDLAMHLVCPIKPFAGLVAGGLL